MAGKRILSFSLALCLLLGMTLVVPGPVAVAAAVEMQEGIPNITVNTTEVAFAGHEWVVIGYNGESGSVYSSGNTATLLLKGSDAGGGFDSVPFRKGQHTDPNDDNMSIHSGNNWWYANNPGGSPWTTPNEYRGSTLQQEMESIAASFPEREQALINERTLTYDDGTYPLTGGDVDDQFLWPLSFDEWDTIDPSVRVYKGGTSSDHWWLRSPPTESEHRHRAYTGMGRGTDWGLGLVSSSWNVRPAFQINLESAIFTSDASGASAKSNANVGDGLVGASVPSGAIKITMRGSNIAKPGLTFNQGTDNTGNLLFYYTGATAGPDQYLSCVLVQGSNVEYYGKLADCASAADSSGEFTIDTSGLTPGTYTLKIFCELANSDDLYTDFAGESVDMSLTISGGNGTIPDFPGDTVDTPAITTHPDDATVVEGDTATFTVAASGGALSYQWQVDQGSGFVDVTDGTGGDTASYTTPAATLGMSGYQYRAVVENVVSNATSNAATLTVNPATIPTTPTLTVTPDQITLTVGGHTDGEIVATASATNFSGTVAYSIDSPPDLPAGLEIDSGTGEIFVDNAAALTAAPEISVTIKADDGTDAETATLKITVVDGGFIGSAPSITTTSLPNGAVGEAYSQALSATGDTPVAWTVDSGSLPLGFSLSTNGVISGTPTQLETADFTVKAENASGSDTQALRITIASGGSGSGNGGSGNGGSSTRSGSSSSGGSGGGSSNVTPAPKTQLPASAFSWDGDRTLTINHDSITALGLLSVRWDGGTELTRGEDYGVYSGSVIVRFSEDFMAAQTAGEHTVRVEFLNHYGETTVTVGATGQTADNNTVDQQDNATYNPNTGGYPDNPQTSDNRSIGLWIALLLGSMGGMALVIWRWRKTGQANA